MGSLSDFNANCKNIQSLKDQYQSTVFVETGCFRGNSLSFVIDMGFDNLYSCDIDQEMINYCIDRFKKPNLQIYHMDSIRFLNNLIYSLANIQSVIFYLDAHLPEHDKTSGSVLSDNPLNFPLEEEISVINKHRSDKNDIIIIDDLRIYEDGPFTGGNWTERYRFNPSLSFLDQYDYNIEKFYSQEGYLVLTNRV